MSNFVITFLLLLLKKNEYKMNLTEIKFSI